MRTWRSWFLALTLPILPLAVLADDEAKAPAGPAEVVASCEKALAAAKAGQWDAVIESCQKAIDAAQQIQQGGMAAVFPDAPGEGWVAGEIESQRWAGSGGGEVMSWIHLSRTYTNEKQDLSVEALLTNWGTLQAGFRGLLEMKGQPQMLEMMGMTFFQKDGFSCIKMVPPDGDDTQILAFGEKRMLQIQCSKKRPDVAQTFFDRFDLKKTLGESK